MNTQNRGIFTLGYKRGAAMATGLLALALLPASAWGQNLYESDATNVVNLFTSGGNSTFATSFDTPQGLAFNSTGTLFVANQLNGTISEVTSGGNVSTFATGLGSGSVLTALAFNATGTLFAGVGNKIDEVTPGGVVSTFVTGLSSVFGLAFNSTGTLFASNFQGQSISEVTPGGNVTTFVAFISRPWGLAFNSTGTLFVANGNGISEVTPGGVASTFVSGFSGEGIAFNSAGDLFVANPQSHSIGPILEVTPSGNVTTFASNLEPTYVTFPAGVPEPATYAVLAGGAALGWAGLRRRARKTA
jgi:hypothetical protein